MPTAVFPQVRAAMIIKTHCGIRHLRRCITTILLHPAHHRAYSDSQLVLLSLKGPVLSLISPPWMPLQTPLTLKNHLFNLKPVKTGSKDLQRGLLILFASDIVLNNFIVTFLFGTKLPYDRFYFITTDITIMIEHHYHDIASSAVS